MKILIMTAFVSVFVNSASAEELSANPRVISARADVGFMNYGSFTIHDSSTGIRFDLDIAKDVKAFSGHFGSKDGKHNGSVGLLFKNSGPRKAFGFRGKYTLNLSLYNGEVVDLLSESSLAAGVVGGKYASPSGRVVAEFHQFLFGAKQHLGIRIGENQNVFGFRVGAERTQSNHKDDYGSMSQWDSQGFGIDSYFSSKLSEGVMLRMRGEAMKKKYNPELYFFVEDWVSEVRVLSEIILSPHSRLDIIPSFNWRRLDIERDGRADLERPEFGGTLMLKDLTSYGINVFMKYAHAPWRHKRGGETLMSVGLWSSGLSAELYRRSIKDQYSSFELRETMTGIQLSWKFGSRKMKSVDDYGDVLKEKYRFFLDDGFQDDRSLTRVQQAERLGTIRKRNEWSNNYRYLWATNNGWGFRSPDEVYNLRGGDCDEQACANSSMDTLNGYNAYELDYWDSSKSWIGHGVEIMQDKINGQWFLDEYGMIYKIDVSPDADLKTVARAALSQTNGHLALRIDNPEASYFRLIDCLALGGYKWITSSNLRSMSMRHNRPQLEYGHELFTKRDFLFSY